MDVPYDKSAGETICTRSARRGRHTDVPYDKSAGETICTRSARRGRHTDVPYETLTLIPAYMCSIDWEME
jgi:hypothetical protein